MIPSLSENEREHILEALREARGVIRAAAINLGIPRTSLMLKMSRHNISREEIYQGCVPTIPATEDPNIPSVDSRKMVQVATELRSAAAAKKNSSAKVVSRRIYGTIDYIAAHVFRGPDKMIEYARLVAEDGDARFQAFIEAWDKDREFPMGHRVSLTELLKEAGINSIDFCVEVMRSCMKRNMEISNIYAGLAHPKVVQANIKQAMKAKGVKDREMFLQHSGWLPMPKGSTVNVLAQSNSAATSVAAAAIGVGEKTENTALPAFEEMTVEGSKIVRREFEEADDTNSR